MFGEVEGINYFSFFFILLVTLTLIRNSFYVLLRKTVVCLLVLYCKVDKITKRMINYPEVLNFRY